VAITEVVEKKIGIAQYGLASTPERLITLGLGSCVGVTLYDRRTRWGAMVHILLPDSKSFKDGSNPAKFADTGIVLIYKELEKKGSRKSDLEAKLAGGAKMFNFNDSKVDSLNIGERNVKKCLETLEILKIKITGQDTGENYGRTMILDTADGIVYIRTAGRQIKTI